MYGSDIYIGWHGVALGTVFIFIFLSFLLGGISWEYIHICAKDTEWHTVHFPNVFGYIARNRRAALCSHSETIILRFSGFTGAIAQLACAQKSHDFQLTAN